MQKNNNPNQYTPQQLKQMFIFMFIALLAFFLGTVLFK